MISNSNIVGGALPGLTLKAWAQFKADGTLIRGFNIASVAKGGTGSYTITFTSATATNTYTVRALGFVVAGGAVTQAYGWALNTRTTAAFQLLQSVNGATTDMDSFVEVYE